MPTQLNTNTTPLAATTTQLLLLLALILPVSLYIVYQCLFHPLATYPGPFLGKLSLARATYHAWKGDIHLDIWQLHKTYGPIVRYGPNWLLFNSVEAYKDIYSGTSNTGKHPQFSQFNPRATNLFTTADKAEHRSRRRCIGTSFSDAQMKGFEGRLRGHVDKFCDLITSSPIAEGSEWSLPLQMSDSVGYFVFDTVTGFLLSQDYNLLGASKDRHIIRHIKQHTIRLAVCSYMPILALLKMDKLFFRRATRSTRIFWRWVKSAIASKGQQSEAPQDVFARIQLSRRSQESPTMGMLSDIFMFIVAGLDTTTTALCALLFYLSMNPDAYERLCREVRTTFQSVKDIQLGHPLKSCPFLHACIDEALRMSPPVGSAPWREVGPGGQTIDGYHIPPGCSVGTCIYSMHHTEDYFANPHDFLPERWLHEPKGSYSKADRRALMPFSRGPRSCIGKSLALAEISLAIAVLLWKFDFRAAASRGCAPGGGKAVAGLERAGRANPAEFQLIDQVLGLAEGPTLEFRPRNES